MYLANENLIGNVRLRCSFWKRKLIVQIEVARTYCFSNGYEVEYQTVNQSIDAELQHFGGLKFLPFAKLVGP